MNERSIETKMHPQSKVEIKAPIQETGEPTENLTEDFDKLFYRLGQVTKAKFLDRSVGEPSIKRPLFARTTRAELYKQLKNIPKEESEERKKIIKEAHLRDDITRQYLNQGEIVITFPFLGIQKARFINVIPPEAIKTSETESKPPIFLIPGISNDIECVGGLVQEMAMQGRRVIVVAHPESFKGRVTKEFADAVEKDSEYGPHVEFYKQAINNLIKENEKLELWGYSTGVPIAEKILNDPKFQDKTENAVLLCPASSVNQSRISMNIGITNELKMLVSKCRVVPKLSCTKASRNSKDEDQILLKKRVLKLIMNRIRNHVNYLEGARVQEGGSIVIVSGKKDRITKSSKATEEFLQNPKVRVLNLRNGYHASPGVEAEKILPLIFYLQGNVSPTSFVFSSKI